VTAVDEQKQKVTQPEDEAREAVQRSLDWQDNGSDKR
jgi:hypothetical protein